MADLPALDTLNWNSDTCECKVEVRRYVIDREPSKVVRVNGKLDFAPERVWCRLHKLDGSVTEIPMRVTTVWEMAESGLQPEYWADAALRQREQIAANEKHLRDITAGRAPAHRTDPEWLARFGDDPERAAKMAAIMPDPQDFCGWEGQLEVAKVGKTYADHEGYRRSPGTQDRGHLSHRCARHHNQTSTSLQSQVAVHDCGCKTRQITVGERREQGINHMLWIEVCPRHRKKLTRKAFAA